MAAGGASSAAAGEAKLVAAHRVFLQTSGIQHAFDRAPPSSPPPGWLLELFRVLAAAAPVLKVIFWVGVAAAGAAILWLIVRDLPFLARVRKRASRDQLDWRPEAAAARALLDEADLLARQGRFDEAIHILLFRSIEDIAARRPEAVRAAFTSRDIVEAAPLSETGRAAFRGIAEAVERSFFAGRAADQQTFERCRTEYEAFVLAEAGR